MASRVGLEGASRRIEDLQRFCSDKFKEIKEEFNGIDRDFVSHYKLTNYDKINTEKHDRSYTGLQSVLSAFEDVHSKIRRLERKTDEDIPF